MYSQVPNGVMVRFFQLCQIAYESWLTESASTILLRDQIIFSSNYSDRCYEGRSEGKVP